MPICAKTMLAKYAKPLIINRFLMTGGRSENDCLWNIVIEIGQRVLLHLKYGQWLCLAHPPMGSLRRIIHRVGRVGPAFEARICLLPKRKAIG